MAKKTRDQGLANAVAAHGGLFATLTVLLIGTAHGAEAWFLLLKAATTFLLVSAVLHLASATVLQLLCRTSDTADQRNETEVRQTARVITSSAQSPESMESALS